MAETKIIVIPEGKICDYVDGKFRNDTPEEYVRQTIEKRLVNEHKYLPKQIKIEYTLQLGSRKPRADIVIFDKDCTEQTQENIKLIIECKKETVEARNAKDGVEQLKSYMSACPNCEWGMWTNGKQKEVYRKYVNDKGQIDFMDYNDIPSADGSLDDINRPKRTSLKNAYDDNLLFVFKTCHNHIHVNDGLQKQPAFFELLKVIFCKIEDERNIPNPLEFYTTSEERSNPDGQLTVKKRISKIFERVKKKHGKIFDSNDEIKLAPRSLAYIVSELQKYSLLNTNIDIKGKAYEEIVGATIGDERISSKVILPGRFKRVYVEEGYGRVFIGGKQLGELDPTNKKYLSLTHHADRIAKQLELHENMTLITCSGTIGKVALVGKQWENWTANQHIIRVVPACDDIAGYLNIFLSSEYGHQLITRFTYGSVVDEIDDNHIRQIVIPLLKNKDVQKKINDLALEASQKRYEAYMLEQEALKIMNEEVIYAK
jgi:type I restriction-modification system, M subunit